MVMPKLDEEAIFNVARQIEAAEARRQYLQQSCGDDAELQARVEALLRVHDEEQSFLQSPVEGLRATVDEPPVAERPGTVIGPYKLLEQIGEGGFGVVFMAEQQQPLRRKVALKVIKPGMDTRQVVARFEAERQALALMDHPNIAHVFDGGETASGRPYFVMELVKGVPITDFCDQSHLSVRERLELFVSVCQAVQHAHQKGIIHRDLKPTNLMVTMHDNVPVAKVIDFGIAKATGQQLTEKTLFTNFAQMVGTPLYMSPEQAGQSGLDVDTRSDIYSLGVLLYELLTGTTPFDKERLRTVGYDEMRRIIREEEPARPSTRLSTLGQAATSVSANRGSNPRRLSQLFRGELDWIVMKCLEKDRNRRYETASGFAADVQRYLADEPVQACPPSVGYRFRKFARRNKRALAVAGLVLFFVALLGGGAGWVLHDRSTRRGVTAEHVNRALRESENLYRQGKLPDALVAARESRALLEHGGGSEALWHRVRGWLADLEMAGRLDEARLEGTAINEESRFAFDATARAYAEAFRDYGIDVETLEPAEAAERIRRQDIREHLMVTLDHWASLSIVDPKVKQRLTAIVTAADADADAWRSQMRAAAGENAQTLKKLAASPEVLGQPPSTLILLGTYLHTQREIDAAINLMRNAQRRHPGDFWINDTLADYLVNANPDQRDEVIRFRTAAVALRPQSPGAHWKLAFALGKKGLPDEAIASYQEAIRLKPEFTYAHLDYGTLLVTAKGDYEGAIVKFSRAIELDPKLLRGWVVRGCSYLSLGRHDKALADFSKAIELDPREGYVWSLRGDAYLAMGQRDKALAEFTKAIELKEDFAPAWCGRGKAYIALGQPDKAVADFSRALELNPQDGSTRLARAHAYRGLRQWDKAIADFSAEIDRYPNHALAWLGRGQTYRQQGQRDKAVADFTKVIERKPVVAWAWSERGQVYAELGRWKEAAADFAKVVASEPNQPAFWDNHALAHLAAGDTEAYRRVCAGMLERFQKTKDPAIAGRVATTCVAAPEAVAVPAHLVALAQLACSVNRQWNVGLLGAAYYRAGQPGPALECFKEKAKVHPLRAWDLLFMAMAHRDLDHAEEARNCLRRAVQWLAVVGPPGLPDDVGKPGPRWFSWQDEVVVQLLRRKAEELLKKESGVKNQKEQTDHKDR